MNAENTIKSVIDLIGKNDKNDYILDPEAHLTRYEKEAPGLANILKASEINSAAKEYSHWNDKAIDAQGEFVKWSKYGNGAIFITACVTAGLIASGVLASFPSLDKLIVDVIIGVLSAASIVFSVSAGICIRRINTGDLLRKWMQNRAEAETRRLQYFNLITGHQPEEGKDKLIPAALLKLEYFRRYQLDVQLAYYKVRGQEHTAASKKALALVTLTLGIVAVVNGLAGIFGILNEKLVVVSAIALVSQAFASKISFTEAVNQDKRNAERYERTWSILNKLSSKLDEVREGIVKGKLDVLGSFVESVQEQLSLEHRQWLEEFEKRSDAIGRLEQQLEALKDR